MQKDTTDADKLRGELLAFVHTMEGRAQTMLRNLEHVVNVLQTGHPVLLDPEHREHLRGIIQRYKDTRRDPFAAVAEIYRTLGGPEPE